jgi:endonuclease/exonuclease/phosphatase family metal-dependent hydrolase
LRILSWNLFHGRSVPAAGRALGNEFSAMLASWAWDVALLQEVPPWWPPMLASVAGADQRTALTSRNSALALRRGVADRWPDLIKSNGGGSNAILSRSSIVEHRALTLRRWPERRVAQLARLGDGTCVVNFHGSARVELAEDELERLWERALAWASEAPLILGGDLNLRHPAAPGGVVHLASRDVDHIFAQGADPLSPGRPLDRRLRAGEALPELSDHPPLLASARPSPPLSGRESETRL